MQNLKATPQFSCEIPISVTGKVRPGAEALQQRVNGSWMRTSELKNESHCHWVQYVKCVYISHHYHYGDLQQMGLEKKREREERDRYE